LERNRRGKEKITRWDQMVKKIQRQFIPIDYELDFLKKMQGFKKEEYIEEFYRVLIKTSHSEANKEKFPCYKSVKAQHSRRVDSSKNVYH
jgi:hypothetical protein